MDRESAQKMWTVGDYNVVAEWIGAASKDCLYDIDVEGKRVLDVACGTGTIAIEAASQGAHVTGVDLTPKMLEIAQHRANKAGVNVNWQEGSFTDLGGLGKFDLVTSGFGVIFAGEQAAEVAGQLLDACLSGGIVSLTTWDMGGAFSMPAPLVELLGVDNEYGPEKWGDPKNVRRYFEESGREHIFHEELYDRVEIRFESVEQSFDRLCEVSGPWQMLLGHFDSQGQGEQAREIILDHLRSRVREPESGEGIAYRVGYYILRIEAV
jgi:SAM-dependent methyltransferase